MSYIGPITKDIIDTCSKELKKKEVREKIMKNLIDPVVAEIFSRYYPFITCFIFIHLITICMLVYLIYLVKK
jgi:hypothetical protein